MIFNRLTGGFGVSESRSLFSAAAAGAFFFLLPAFDVPVPPAFGGTDDAGVPAREGVLLPGAGES